MKLRKVKIRSSISSLVPIISVILLPCILMAGTSFGAGSPFELEISDLEKSTAKKPAVKVKKKRPASKTSKRTRAVTKQPVQVESDGEYLKYTIRPGDHIYKVLTARFGLSSARAEQLIPTVLRINGISDIAGLQIGQVILIPAAELKTGKPAGVKISSEATPPQTVAPPEKSPMPVLEGGLLEQIRILWARLFPERGAAAGEFREKTIGSHRYPVIKGADLADIIVAREGGLPVFTDVSGTRAAVSERVVVVPADGNALASALLKGAGFEKIDEIASFSFGVDPKVTLLTDFALVKKFPGTETREQILLFTGGKGCPSPPEAMSAFLSDKGFRLVALCNWTSEKPSGDGVVIPLTATDPEKLVDSLLDALSLKWSKAYPVEMVLDQKEGYRIGVNVDRYFEDQGERYFVDFGREDTGHETLMRLVELAGYRRISVDRKAGPAAVAQKFLKSLQLSPVYGKRIFASIPDGRLTIETSGILFSGRSASGKHFLVADPPLAKPVFDLLTAGQWSAK